MNKAELIAWIATLPEDDPRLAAVEKIGAAGREKEVQRQELKGA